MKNINVIWGCFSSAGFLVNGDGIDSNNFMLQHANNQGMVLVKERSKSLNDPKPNT